MAVDYAHANASFFPSGYRWGKLFSRVYLGAYYPPFRARLLIARARAAERGFQYISYFGYRPWLEQHRLRLAFLQGTGGKAAPAGYSAHQYGLADDCVRDTDPVTPGLQPGWQARHYDVWVEELERVGLRSGRSYDDRPHANWPGFESGAELAPLRRHWAALPKTTADEQKLLSCWQYLDSLPQPALPQVIP